MGFIVVVAVVVAVIVAVDVFVAVVVAVAVVVEGVDEQAKNVGRIIAQARIPTRIIKNNLFFMSIPPLYFVNIILLFNLSLIT
jgi:hypothetical protein